MGHGRNTTLGFGIWVFSALSLVAGCGGRASDGGAATDADSSASGRAGSSTQPPASGAATASGGNGATGGSPGSNTGGSLSIGGAASTGGKSGLGGAQPTGGKSGLGGAVPTGGKTATGGATSTSGASAVGGATTGGATTGGSSALGGSAGGAGVGSSAGRASAAGSSGVAGSLLSSFCQGEQSKVLYQGRDEVLAPATSYMSNMVMGCCSVYGVNLHARPALGFEVAVETIWTGGGTTTPGIITLGTSTARVRVVARRSTDPITPSGELTDGYVNVFGTNPFEAGLCLSISGGSSLFGTLIYVPRIGLWSYDNRTRFQIFLLSDSSITQAQAVAQGVNAVSLATNPILDLSRIAYVSQSAHEIGFNPGHKIGEILQATVTGPIIQGIPFVIVARGERIALGTFTSGASSIAYGLPTIFMEKVKSDWLVLETGTGSTDPLSDPRVVAALTATGTLIP